MKTCDRVSNSLVALDELAIGQLSHEDHLRQVMLQYYPRICRRRRRRPCVRVRRGIAHDDRMLYT